MKNHISHRNTPPAAKAEVVPSHTLAGSPEPGTPAVHSYIRQKELLRIVPFSPSTLWRKVKAGTFIAPVRLSHRIVAWNRASVSAWLQAQAGRK